MCDHFKSDTVSSIKTMFRVPCIYTGRTDRQTDTHTNTHRDNEWFQIGNKKKTDYGFQLYWKVFEKWISTVFGEANSPKRFPTILKWRTFIINDLFVASELHPQKRAEPSSSFFSSSPSSWLSTLNLVGLMLGLRAFQVARLNLSNPGRLE